MRQRRLHPNMFVLSFKTEEPNFVRPELLLHPQIPWPLYGVNPRTIEGEAWWDKTRKAAFAENNNCCHACGTHRLDGEYRSWLEGHECYRIDYKEQRTYYLHTVGLCYACHRFVHRGNLPTTPWNPSKQQKAINVRGYQLLRDANLALPPEPPILLPGAWSLIYKGHEWYALGQREKL